MAEFPYMPLFTDAYFADTQHLTNEEHGAYLRLLMFAWRSPDCSLPNDDVRLSQMLGLTMHRWHKIRATILGFWKLQGDRWTQKRLSRERARLINLARNKVVNKEYHEKSLSSEHRGKSLKNYGCSAQKQPRLARAREFTLTKKDSAPHGAQSLSPELPEFAPAAPLREAAGSSAPRPALLSEENNPEPSGADAPVSPNGECDEAERQRIIAGFEALTKALTARVPAELDRLEAAPGTEAERQRQQAEARLEVLQQRAAAPLTVSPVLLSSRLVADTVSQKVKLARKPRRKRAKPTKSRLIPANHMH